MTDGLPDVPDWIEEKIEFNDQRTVQHHHIIDYFQSKESPFLSVRQVASKFDMSRQWGQDRLDELEELGILDSCPGAGGRLYWIRDDRSEWPIPPDVEVAPVDETDELTVSELTDRLEVQFAALAAGAGWIASMSLLTAITMSVTGYESTSIIDPLFIAGMVIALVSAVLVIFAIGTWGYKLFEGDE